MTTTAIQLLNRGYHLTLCNDAELSQASWTQHLFQSSHRTEVQKIIDFIKEKLHCPHAQRHADYLRLADAFILRYRQDQSVINCIRAFDRTIAPLRNNLTYLEPKNQINFDKWKRAGQPLKVFRDFPEFTEFLESSFLLSQLKVTRDKIRMIDGKPALLVEKRWMKASEVLKRFNIVYSKKYDSTFIVHRASKEVYTYLDNGRGLQKHHPFLSAQTPISVLSSKDYRATLAKAYTFIRANEISLSKKERARRNRKRTFILQYVTSRTPRGNSNFSQLIRNPRHPFMRLIIGQDNPALHTKKGEVYEAGYGWKRAPLLPGLTQHGRFRSPDPWEYKASVKTVTNIPITQKEAHQFYRFSMKYHIDGVDLGKEPSFNLFHQNCSVYAKEASRAAGLLIPTEVPMTEALFRILPKWIQQIGNSTQSATCSTLSWFRAARQRIIPQPLTHALQSIENTLTAGIRKLTDLFLSLVIIPIRAALGGAFGSTGAAFRQLDEPQGTHTPPLRNWRNWFSLSNFTIHLPGIAEEWQLKQPSTVVYPEDRVKLAIAPI